MSEDSRLSDLRVAYDSGPLLEADLAPDPLAMFRRWFAAAMAAGIPEPNAMTVATSTLDGDISARTVLLKDVGPRGFVFYTNRRSRKGRDLAENPRAALVVPWLALHRQVVVSGEVSPVTRGEVEAYFATRPYGSRIGAWASHQSAVLPSRAALDDRVADLVREFPEGTGVPVPDEWGGYVVRPVTVEFWQGRASRLHDRLRYRQVSPDRLAGMDEAAGWLVERLSP